MMGSRKRVPSRGLPSRGRSGRLWRPSVVPPNVWPSAASCRGLPVAATRYVSVRPGTSRMTMVGSSGRRDVGSSGRGVPWKRVITIACAKMRDVWRDSFSRPLGRACFTRCESPFDMGGRQTRCRLAPAWTPSAVSAPDLKKSEIRNPQRARCPAASPNQCICCCETASSFPAELQLLVSVCIRSAKRTR